MAKKESYWNEFIPKSFICFKEGYNRKIFKKDLLAGITVGIVALPLAMAFAIASGVDPIKGIYTAIIAGFLISFLGGSKVQIGGPTGAFVIIVYEIIQKNGYEGLALATLIAAGILLIMGFCRLGTLIKYIPYPLTMGFTTGIAVIIFSSQVKDFFGLKMGAVPANFIEKWQSFFQAFPTLDLVTFYVAGSSLCVIIFIRRFCPIIPWGISSIFLATAVCWGFDLQVETITSRFGEISRTLPMPHWPEFQFKWESFPQLIPDALTIALLAGIESLLSAVVADGMTGGRHKSNCELVAQGAANLGSILFGGIPATGAIARTATNIKTGARTPIAGMIHSFTLFLVIMAFAPWVGRIPLPALSAVLIMVAWNMSELNHFRHLMRAPLGDVAVLMTAFLLTVFVDLTVAVEVGMILAAFLFMKRMSDIANVVSPATVLHDDEIELSEKKDPDAIFKKKVPPGVEVYEISGPFFFGVAESLKMVLHNIEFPPEIFILRMRKVPVIDATGMHALKEFYEKCIKEGTILFLSGVQPPVYKTLKKYGIEHLIGAKYIFSHIDEALHEARCVINSDKNKK